MLILYWSSLPGSRDAATAVAMMAQIVRIQVETKTDVERLNLLGWPVSSLKSATPAKYMVTSSGVNFHGLVNKLKFLEECRQLNETMKQSRGWRARDRGELRVFRSLGSIRKISRAPKFQREVGNISGLLTEYCRRLPRFQVHAPSFTFLVAFQIPTSYYLGLYTHSRHIAVLYEND